jgi:accessory gene regulator B
LARELELERQKEIEMTFGLELLLAAGLKFGCIVVLAYFFGIFRETMVLVLTAGIFRVVSGGEHCQAFYRCLIGGTVVFLLLGYLAKVLMSVTRYEGTTFLIVLVSFMLVTAIISKYAPGDTEDKPITEEFEIIRFKRLSLLVAVGFFIMVVLFLIFEVYTELILPVIMGLLWQVFTITPLGYRFIRGIDSVLRFSKLWW